MTPSDLRTRRERLGLTQTELAARLGVTQQNLSRWERGTMAVQHPRMLALALDQLERERGVDQDQAVRTFGD